MKLLDILQEAITEYTVTYTVIKNKNVSKGKATYKDLADAKKFHDSLKNDPEVYNSKLEKVFGEDPNSDIGAMKYLGGKETIEYYNHPATKGVDQGGKRFDELTPAEQDIRMFANSRLGTMGKRGFTSKDGTYKYLEEETSLEEVSLSSLRRQIKDAEEILRTGMADGVPLDNETEMLVQQELAKLKKQAAVEYMRTRR
jgi:hypothetical protein